MIASIDVVLNILADDSIPIMASKSAVVNILANDLIHFIASGA